MSAAPETAAEPLFHFANRLYEQGHVPADFAECLPGLVIVSPIRPPGMTSRGSYRPPESCAIAGQFCLAHRVEAVGPPCGDATVLPLEVGDIVKCREAHLDPIDPKGDLCGIRAQHVISVIRRDGVTTVVS